MHQPIHAVIFDSDGTLVDTEVAALDVIHTQAQAAGLVLTREFAHRQFRGIRMADVARYIGQQLGQTQSAFDADFIRKVRAATAEKFEQGISAMPGAETLLSSLAVPYCIATNGPREKIELTLRLCGIRAWFGAHVYCAYEVGSFKPEPDLFLHAAQALRQAPAHCAVVEDSVAGIEAGLAAGMQVFTVLPPQDIPVAWRDRVTPVDGLHDLHQRWRHLCRL